MQLQLDLDSRLTERYASLTDICRAAVARSRRPQKAIAADMDLSPSDLSRKLSDNPTDTRRLLAEDVVPLARACGDSGRDIAIWIAETLLCDERSKQERAAELILRLGPVLEAAAATLAKAEPERPGTVKIVR